MVRAVNAHEDLMEALEHKLALLAYRFGMSIEEARAQVEQYMKPEQTREARMEEIERRRDTVLAECNPNLPTYEAK